MDNQRVDVNVWEDKKSDITKITCKLPRNAARTLVLLSTLFEDDVVSVDDTGSRIVVVIITTRRQLARDIKKELIKLKFRELGATPSEN